MSELDYNKITAEVITDLAKSSAKAVWNKITQTYKDSGLSYIILVRSKDDGRTTCRLCFYFYKRKDF